MPAGFVPTTVKSQTDKVSFLRRLFLSVNSKLFTAKTHMETDYLYKDSQMNFTCIQTGRGSHWLRCSPSRLPRWPEQSPRSRRKRSRGTWRCAKLNKFISVIDAREGKGRLTIDIFLLVSAQLGLVAEYNTTTEQENA